MYELILYLFSFFVGLFIGGLAMYLIERKIERATKLNTLSIPQPKFSIGDNVHDFWKNKTFKVENMSYSVIMRHWYYYDGSKGKGSTHREDQLKQIKGE